MYHRCKTKEDVKTLFRKLAKYLHPDHGGDHECFILLNESYEEKILSYQSENKVNVKKEFKGNPGKYQTTSDKIHHEDEEIQILFEIMEYALKHKRFNTDYINSVHDFLLEKGYVTSSQYNSLVKIYYSFRIDEEENIE